MEEIKLCTKCNKNFILKWTIYPCNMDDKRVMSINCPYCTAEVGKIRLRGNEDIVEIKIQ